MARGVVLDASDGKFRCQTEASEVAHLDTSGRGENVNIISLLLDSWMCLLADSPLIRLEKSKKPLRTYKNFRRDFLLGPLRTFIKRYASLSHAIVSDGTLYGSGTYTGAFVPEMKSTPIFREYLHWYKTGDTQVLSFIYSFLNFGKKLSFMDDDLDLVAFRGWESVEERLSGLQFDDDVTNVLRRIITGLVDLPTAFEFRPKFGPGHVSEVDIVGRIKKANSLLFDPRVDRILFRGQFNNYGLNEELGFHPEKVIPDPSKWNEASGRSLTESALRFVPKDVTKSRSICMEPNTFMFAQQGISLWLREGMKKGPIRKFVQIDDQSRNKTLACAGSITGDIDTIDLSSASDSVSIDLVRRIFPRRILYYLLGSRTTDVCRRSTGEVIRVKKFAPMGSALCFPVQCIIFTSIVVYAAIVKAHGLAAGCRIPLDSPWLDDIEHTVDTLFHTEHGSYILPGSVMNQPAAVYGDDICVDSSLTNIIVHLLTSLGFEVNLSKSFRGSQCFRESCGGFYYNGVDVTPLYFRVKRYRGKIGPGSVASMIACANHAGDMYYLYLRRCMIHTLLDSELLGIRKTSSPNPVVFSSRREMAGSIFSVRPRNDHLKHRLMPDMVGKPWFQVNEVLCIQEVVGKRLKCSKREISALERYLYLQWWAVRGEEDIPAGEAASRSDEVGSRLAREWVPWRG